LSSFDLKHLLVDLGLGKLFLVSRFSALFTKIYGTM
jgi:hypothetical protein